MNLHKRVYTTLRSEGGEAEDRRQKAEDRGQMTEVRGQRSEGWKVGKKTEKPDRGLEGWLNIYTSTHITF